MTAEPKVHVFGRSENAQEIGFSSDVPSSSEGIMKWFSSVFLVTPTLGKHDIWRHTNRPWSRHLPRSTLPLKPHFQTGNFSACSRRRPHQKQLTELFGKAKGTISEHIFDDGELTPAATVRLYRTVRSEGGREVGHLICQSGISGSKTVASCGKLPHRDVH